MDRKLHPRRMHALGTAVAAVAARPFLEAQAAAEADFAAQLREANLKLPIKDKMRDLARQMQQHLDAELQKAVERFLGHPVTDPRQVAGRLTHQQPPVEALRDAAQGEACTIYSMDGVPVLKAGAQVLERRGDELHAFQLVEQLLPEDFKPTGTIALP